MKVLSFLLLILMIHLAPSLTGQVVNIESARIQSDTTGWAGSGGASFSLEKNTQKIFTVDVEAHVQYKTKKDLWLLLADYGFLKGGSQKFVYNSFAHLRYNHKINNLIRWEVFAQAQNNFITQIKWRFLFGTGPRFKLLALPRFRMYAATLLMYENETEDVKPEVVHRDFRSSSYVSVTILPTENIELVSTLFFQPRLNHFGDRRIFNQSQLRISATRRFAMFIRLNHLYDTRPAGTAPRTTYNFMSGFNIKL